MMEAYVPLQQQAYDHIVEMIHQGKLERGQIYSEKKIASEIGMSRTPVRDAILRLSQDRYLDIVPSKGFQLHVMTGKDIQDAYEVRTAIEGFCAVELHERRNEPDGAEAIRKIRDDLEAMKKAIEGQGAMKKVIGDPEAGLGDEILRHDFAFHREIVRAGGNRDFIRLFESYYHMLLDIADISFQDPARPARACEEHLEIYKNLISDQPGAEVELYRSVMNHMKASRDIALQSLE